MRFDRLILPAAILLVAFAAGVAIAAPLLATQTGEARRTIAGSKYTEVFGHPITLGASQSAAMVFIFINTECPISNGLVPEMNRLAGIAQTEHLEFYGVLSDPAVTREAGQKHSADYKIAFPVIFDASGTLAKALQPTATPHAFVISTQGKLLYDGRINDAYIDVGKPRGTTTQNDLADAMAAVAAGKKPALAQTTPVGCIFEAWKHPDKQATITWSRDIAPLLYANCTACHHEGEVAPFSLMHFQDAAKRADMLAAVTDSGQMPPWKAADTWGTFHDERRLTPDQIQLLQSWAGAGAPEGDKADAPPQPVYSDGWKLGTPDLVVKMAKPFHIPASGNDLFTFSVIPLNLPGGEYVTGFEYRPGNRRVVHHMIAFLDSSGAAQELADQKGDGATYLSFGGPGFVPTGGIGGWAPGATPRLLPDGTGHPVKPGSDVVMNIHYHPTGRAETDQGELALYFAKKPVKQVVVSYPLRNRDIDIPAGDADYIRTAAITTPVDVTLQGVTPHMHTLGREMKVTATFADGRKQQLIDISDWDWNWQDQFQYLTPIKLPRGTKVDLWARYDNSASNPRNPQTTPKRVTYGEQTSNEMCIAFLALTVDGSHAPALGAAASADAPGDNGPAGPDNPAVARDRPLRQLLSRILSP